MLAVLSPAKKLHEQGLAASRPYTTPVFLDDAAKLASIARAQGEGGLRRLMKLSEGLASLNAARFDAWQANPSPEMGRQAALLFAGDTYQGFRAETLQAEDLAWAQEHVAILSGLYGILRPLDVICPYRLEMGIKLAQVRGPDLYAWWGEQIALRLRDQLASHREKLLVVLASQEYASAIDRSALGYPVLDVRFEEVSGSKSKVVSFYAKRARGAMARAMIEGRWEHKAQIQTFSEDCYRFDEARSTPECFVFTRGATGGLS